jgi:RNA polymerase sigma-70 factor (ECF subfamily)
MTSPQEWLQLIARLESDLQRRRGSRGVAAEDAWLSLKEFLRSRARVLPRIHPTLQPSDCEDIAQDVTLKLQSLETIRRWKVARSPEGYLVVMLRNAATDLLRRKSREQNWAEPEAVEILPGKSAPFELRHLVQEQLLKLSSEERTLINMRFWEGLTIQQVAERLQVSYSAAAVRVFRLLKKIKGHLEQPSMPQ